MGLNLMSSLKDEKQKPENLIEDFKEQIEEIFKNRYIEHLNRAQKCDLQSLVDETMTIVGIQDYKLHQMEAQIEWFEKINNLAHLKNLINDQNIFEILIHTHDMIQIDVGKRLTNIQNQNFTRKDHQLSLEALAQHNEVEWNYLKPFASFFTTLYGSYFRASLLHHSITPKKESKLFLRRISKKIFSWADYNLSDHVKDLVDEMLRKKSNVVISGATGSGKSSFLSTMIDNIDHSEHLVILEDTHELNCNRKNISYLISKDCNSSIPLKEFCAHSLRIRPDRIILGEMRSHEVAPFILAMNTGHRGLISSIHANSASDALIRLATLFTMYSEGPGLDYNLVLKMVCQNIDYVIHMKNKTIIEIIKVIGSDNHIPFFEKEYDYNI